METAEIGVIYPEEKMVKSCGNKQSDRLQRTQKMCWLDGEKEFWQGLDTEKRSSHLSQLSLNFQNQQEDSKVRYSKSNLSIYVDSLQLHGFPVNRARSSPHNGKLRNSYPPTLMATKKAGQNYFLV